MLHFGFIKVGSSKLVMDLSMEEDFVIVVVENTENEERERDAMEEETKLPFSHPSSSHYSLALSLYVNLQLRQPFTTLQLPQLQLKAILLSHFFEIKATPWVHVWL
ncbi:uncharacterized protein DS421_4g122660 [Arachis hypogaea]|nr:uncharacterized protein DS421_4g122660 [Arachis hypogaea]